MRRAAGKIVAYILTRFRAVGFLRWVTLGWLGADIPPPIYR